MSSYVGYITNGVCGATLEEALSKAGNIGRMVLAFNTTLSLNAIRAHIRANGHYDIPYSITHSLTVQRIYYKLK